MKLRDLPPAALAKVAHFAADSFNLELPQPKGWFILTLLYLRGEKSRGGIIFADRTKQEDIYQGRCGLVLAVGPEAYADQDKFASGPWCQPGDWVMWPAMEAASSRFQYGALTLALIADDRVMAAGLEPELTIVG